MSIAIMASTTMVAMDTTIANVALPHMQATVLASQEQIIWTLTAYIIAAAIGTPLASWMANRFGRKRILLMSMGAFTVSSALCGLSGTLEMLVLSRFLQGLSGAGLIPLSQATLLDIYPPEKHAKMMAMLGIGSLAGPIAGPTLGGWLTDSFSWRWVFFINLPLGIAALAGFVAAFPPDKRQAATRFDMFGFATLAIALASLQLFLDRGEHLGWLDSTEAQIWLAICLLFAYLTIVHMVTRPNGFIKPVLFKDRNFAFGCALSASVGIVAFATIPMLTILMQNMLGYSAMRTGLVGAPRGVGTLIGLLVVTRIVGRIDSRHLIAIGMFITAVGQMMYARLSLYTDQEHLLIGGFVQGFGSGLMFVPLSTIVFATLSPALRNEGAAMFSLTRNIGNSIGISFIQQQIVRDTAAHQARLVEGVRPDSPTVGFAMPDLDFASVPSLAQFQGELVRQASMAAYVQVFWLVCIIAFIMTPVAYLMRSSGKQARKDLLPVLE